MSAHAVSIDVSPDTGSLACCICGWSLGPYAERGRARQAAADHRRWIERERDHDRHARKAAARRAAREGRP